MIFSAPVVGTGNLIKAGNNTLTLSSSSSTYTGSTIVNGGTLVFNATHRINSLTINSGAQASISAGENKLLKVSSLTIAGGTLDMTDEAAIIVSGSSSSTVRGWLSAGYSGGTWVGAGITSSSARALALTPGASKTAIGYAAASEYGQSTFHGEVLLGSEQLLQYTLAGDANLDSKVNALDFNSLATNFGIGNGKTWTQGDFNYDGVVNTSDFVALSANFNAVLAARAMENPLNAVAPEPASVCVIAGLMTGMRFARRRRWLRH